MGLCFSHPSDRDVEAPASWALEPRLTLARAPTKAPNCIICGKPTVLLTTGSSNRKGNAGRPFYKCEPCNKFHCFADERGNDPDNPLCDCGHSSKRQISGPETRVARQVHYVCRMGGCDFFKAEGVTVDERFVGTMARHYVV